MRISESLLSFSLSSTLPTAYIYSRKIRSTIYEFLLYYFFLFDLLFGLKLALFHDLFPQQFSRLVSPRRQQRIVENLNDRFVRPRLDSYPSTVSFLELLNVARSRVGISQKTSHGGIEFHATRDSTLFLLQAQMFCIYNRESSNRMEFKPRIYIYNKPEDSRGKTVFHMR